MAPKSNPHISGYWEPKLPMHVCQKDLYRKQDSETSGSLGLNRLAKVGVSRAGDHSSN